MNKIIIFVPIAEREVTFYLASANELRKQNPDWKIVFASLYQPGDILLRKSGYLVWSLYDEIKHFDIKESLDVKQIENLERSFGISNLHRFILHEKLTFNVWNDQLLYKKFYRYLHASEKILTEILSLDTKAEFFLVQELGGFIGPLAFYFSSQKLGIQHFFSEPSFFKGRIHLNLNSLNTEIQKESSYSTSKNQVQNYIDQTLKMKTIVAAAKDQHHFQDMRFKKILNTVNIKKLFKKIIYKYVYKYKQEYEYILNHVLRSLKMYKNRWLNITNYTHQLQDINKPYFYFPFHVQLDYSLTVRSSEWLDQLGLCQQISQRLAGGAVLVAKEHPASIGCLDQNRLNHLLKMDNFILLHPTINSYDVIERSVGVITINSKVGAEALLLEKPVFSFGESFYTNRDYTTSFQNWMQFEHFIKQVLQNKYKSTKDEFIGFLERVWQSSYPTELYQMNKENLTYFKDSVTLAIKTVSKG